MTALAGAEFNLSEICESESRFINAIQLHILPNFPVKFIKFIAQETS